MPLALSDFFRRAIAGKAEAEDNSRSPSGMTTRTAKAKKERQRQRTKGKGKEGRVELVESLRSHASAICAMAGAPEGLC
jgi:hypothetical protein